MNTKLKTSALSVLIALILFGWATDALAVCSDLPKSSVSTSTDRIPYLRDLKDCEDKLYYATIRLKDATYPHNFAVLTQSCQSSLKIPVCNLVVKASNEARAKLAKAAKEMVETLETSYTYALAYPDSAGVTGDTWYATIIHMRAYDENMYDFVKKTIVLDQQISELQSALVTNGEIDASIAALYLQLETEMSQLLTTQRIYYPYQKINP